MVKNFTLVRRSTSDNWVRARRFIPKKFELIIYTDYQPHKLKIGDGKTRLTNLPFQTTDTVIDKDMEI